MLLSLKATNRSLQKYFVAIKCSRIFEFYGEKA
jgi:hypothetical protein